MNAVKEFKGSYVKLFSNALHNGFHTTIWKYLRSLEDKTKIHLSDELLTEYGNNIAAETELNRETRAHVNTAALNEADAKRDKAMSYLFNVIEAAKEAVVPDIQAGGMALSVVILPYKGIQQLAYKEESAAIDGCLQDIRKPENSPYVLSLNLGAALSAADEANQEYKDLEQERRDDKRAKKLEPAKVVRPRTDANFKRICDLIYASQLLNLLIDQIRIGWLREESLLLRNIQLRINGPVEGLGHLAPHAEAQICHRKQAVLPVQPLIDMEHIQVL